MKELILKTPLSMEEIKENFRNFDLDAALQEALDAIDAYHRGEEGPGLVVHERSLPDPAPNAETA